MFNYDLVIDAALDTVQMGPLEELDSLGKMELIMALEDLLGISLPISDMPTGPLTRELITELLSAQKKGNN